MGRGLTPQKGKEIEKESGRILWTLIKFSILLPLTIILWLITLPFRRKKKK